MVNTLGGGLGAAAVHLGASQTDAIEWVSGLNPANYAEAAITLGRRMGPQGDYVLKADAEKSEKLAVIAALRKERGENPERTAVGVDGANNGAQTARTIEAYEGLIAARRKTGQSLDDSEWSTYQQLRSARGLG